MKTFLIKSFATCLLVLALILGSASFALANDGFYLGFSYVENNPGYGFDGDSIYSLDGYPYSMGKPMLDPGAGFTITGGMVVNPIGLEMSYTNSSHFGSCYVGTYTWDGVASFNNIDFDMKIFMDPESSLKPYLLLGMAIPWVVVKDGEHDSTTDGVTGDCTYSGIGLNLGGGIDLEVSKELSIQGEAVYRLAGYSSASGTNVSGDLPEMFSGSGFCFTIGINYIFAGF
ncbi:MAG TPA: outer membrane beta-barrel protein [Bacillota bacterium]|nr:outer membrane beta-barrel protein [Bacillota bacterium]